LVIRFASNFERARSPFTAIYCCMEAKPTTRIAAAVV
jgi:hypothetical protein